MRNRWFHRPLLHTAFSKHEKRPTWLELFFDLIFVAAFIQLGTGLSEHVTPRGVLVFGSAFVALWMVWTGATFVANRYTVDDIVHRTLFLFQMVAVASMALFVEQLYVGDVCAFALATTAGLLLIGAFYFRAYLQVREAKTYAVYWGGVFTVAAVLWLISAFLPFYGALSLWGLSAVLLIVAPTSNISVELAERYPFDYEHLAERFGLLTLIVLGESFVKVLGVLGSEPASLKSFLEGGAALILTSAIWWVYFDDVAGARLRPGRAQWVIWLYGHIPLQLGIVALAVGIKKAIHFSFAEPAPEAYRYLFAGSIATIYFGVAAIDSVTERKQAEMSDRARINARWMSGLLLLVLAPAGRAMSGVVFTIFLLVITTAQVLFDLMMAPFEQHAAFEEGAKSTREIHEERVKGSIPPTARRPLRDASTAVRKGAPSSTRSDLYTYFLSGSWTRVFVASSILFVLANVFFAALYLLEPNTIGGVAKVTFADAFYFSVQTMATIGYGVLHPSPTSTFANLIVSAESLISIVGVAVMTGLIVAKASRTSAGVLFSQVVTVAPRNGVPTLMIRLANARGNEIVDARIQVVVLKDEVSPEGHHMRRLHDLKLERSNTPLFALGWTVMHVIDRESPLYEVDFKNPGEKMGLLMVTMTGHDGTFGQTTYARYSYTPDDLRYGERFVDVMSQLEDGRMMIDFTKFHDTVTVTAPN